MCNQHSLKTPLSEIADLFGSRLATPLHYPEGAPNLEPRDEIRITDLAPIVRAGTAGPELVRPSPEGTLAAARG